MPAGLGPRLLLPVVLLLACVLTDAQQFPNATEALKGTPELSKLYAAALLIDLDMDATFNGRANWEATIFAPTDAAFERMLIGKGITFDEWMSDPEAVKDTWLHHIVGGYQLKNAKAPLWLYDGEILATMLTRVNGRSKLTVVKEPGAPLAVRGDTNTAPFTPTRTISAGARVTLIKVDEVLLPDRTAPVVKPLPDTTFASLADAIQKIPGLETFWSLVQRNTSLLAYLSDPNLNATVFAPNEQGLSVVVETLKITPEAFLANASYTSQVLPYHIAPGITTKALNLTSNQMLPTLLTGRSLEVQRYNGHVVVASPLSKGKVLYNLFNALSILDVRRGTMDVIAGKGMLHVIDGYCLPTEAMAAQATVR